MLDENPNKIGLYADVSTIKIPIINTSSYDIINVAKKVSVFVYNPLNKKIDYQLEDCQVIDYYKVNENKDVNFNADSYIDISINSCDLSNYVNDNYKIFVLNTTEYPFNSSSV